MGSAYLVGHITVKDQDAWAEYRSRVPATLAPWQAELLFRGKLAATLSGGQAHTDIVVIRFPHVEAVHGWHSSPAYQALIPLRERAAAVDLLCYQE